MHPNGTIAFIRRCTMHSGQTFWYGCERERTADAKTKTKQKTGDTNRLQTQLHCVTIFVWLFVFEPNHMLSLYLHAFDAIFSIGNAFIY